jgi:hypothetical protein
MPPPDLFVLLTSCSTNLISILLGDERPWGGGCVSREESEKEHHRKYEGFSTTNVNCNSKLEILNKKVMISSEW